MITRENVAIKKRKMRDEVLKKINTTFQKPKTEFLYLVHSPGKSRNANTSKVF